MRASSSFARSNNIVTSEQEEDYSSVKNKPDRFVSASPLAVAAVCRDGVALVALHTAGDSEPLLFYDNNDDDWTNDNGTEDESNVTATDLVILKDLPMSSRGPLRIQSIDGKGTALLSAGWRADCFALADKLSILAADELAKYGNGGGSHGRYLADAASLWMSHCAFSDTARALSCVGLIASCDGNDNNSFLWLLDATGAYRVRAHAIGHGSNGINQRLLTIDFSGQTIEEGANVLLKLIIEQQQQQRPSDKNVTNGANQSLSSSNGGNVRMEVAGVGSARLRRLRQPFLVHSSTSPSTTNHL